MSQPRAKDLFADMLLVIAELRPLPIASPTAWRVRVPRGLNEKRMNGCVLMTENTMPSDPWSRIASRSEAHLRGS